jgi:tRNA-dihydrouridine synthase
MNYIQTNLLYFNNRMLQTKEQTLELCKMIESTGVKAIAIHCRYE